MPMWSVPRDWEGLTAILVAGGPSVERYKPLDRVLRGRKVVAINSSFEDAPFADVLIFGDARWWRHNERNVRKRFKGEIVTIAAIKSDGVKQCRKSNPPGLSADPCELMMRRTTATAAINFLAHKGVSRIIALGFDGKRSPDGRTHHHPAHPWPQRPDCWVEQRKDLETIAKPLRKLGIELVNASPGSVLDLWPIVDLREVL